MSSSGMAAQLTSTNGPAAREAARVDRARDELLAGPVLAEDQDASLVGAACAISSRRRRRAGLSPTIT